MTPRRRSELSASDRRAVERVDELFSAARVDSPLRADLLEAQRYALRAVEVPYGHPSVHYALGRLAAHAARRALRRLPGGEL